MEESLFGSSKFKCNTQKRMDTEGTGKTPRRQSKADILSQQSSFGIVQVYRIQDGQRCFMHLNAYTCAFLLYKSTEKYTQIPGSLDNTQR